MSGDPVIAALSARVQQLTSWLRIIAEQGDRWPRIRWMTASALAGMEPRDGEISEAVRRAPVCLTVLKGIGTPALVRIAGLDDIHRFGALSDIAKIHHLQAKAANGEEQ